MTNEFKEKMINAMANGIKIARKQDEEYLEKVRNNKPIADLYMQLVLAFVEKYDFYKNSFNYGTIDEELLKQFGQPRSISAWITEKEKEGTISLDYQDETNPWSRSGEPLFKSQKSFDLTIINDILAENGIKIRENSVDGGGYGTQCDYISFDASLLIEARNNLLEESQIRRK